MSLTSVDFPEPLTPVMATKHPRGNATSMLRRLCSRAPSTTTSRPFCLGRRIIGTGMDRRPDRYAPVIDSSEVSRSSTVPSTTISPPCSPARGPMSTTQSALRMVSSSCSTTISMLPRSRSRTSVSISRWLSRWCNPIDGSSSTYRTPTSPLPICDARRIRCASPPASVPDVEQEAEALVDLLQDGLGDHQVALGQAERAEELGRLRDRQLTELEDVH